MADTAVTAGYARLMHFVYQILVEQSTNSLRDWSLCYEFIKANLDVIGRSPPDSFQHAIIEISVGSTGSVGSASNVGKISEMQTESLVTSVIVSIPENSSTIQGYGLYRLILPEIKRLCAGRQVCRNPSPRYQDRMTSDTAAIIEMILEKFPSAKNIFVEIVAPGTNWLRSNKVFRYLVRAPEDEANTVHVGCLPCDERLMTNAASEYYRYLLYYPILAVCGFEKVSQFALFQVIS
ncbi:hypothetical protein GGF46_004486 [Coemansia sp. RSA 552]|nr:hypothetical protein GGF46_004486 [Coemansia sp. RSA 552]